MYKITKDFVDGRISKQRAATKLNKSTRTVERRAKEYREIGKEAFVHKNKIRNLLLPSLVILKKTF